MTSEATPVWEISHRAEDRARILADRHYNRQRVGAKHFVPPGRCVVLVTPNNDAVWVTSWPFAQYTRHAWGGAWVNSLFRNESDQLSSDLIRAAIAKTRTIWPDVPQMGMITFVDTKKTKRKRDPGRCYIKAGFSPAICYNHAYLDLILESCAACQGRTKAGLVALQILPCDMDAQDDE